MVGLSPGRERRFWDLTHFESSLYSAREWRMGDKEWICFMTDIRIGVMGRFVVGAAMAPAN
jgi:hypothetical protein